MTRSQSTASNKMGQSMFSASKILSQKMLGSTRLMLTRQMFCQLTFRVRHNNSLSFWWISMHVLEMRLTMYYWETEYLIYFCFLQSQNACSLPPQSQQWSLLPRLRMCGPLRERTQSFSVSCPPRSTELTGQHSIHHLNKGTNMTSPSQRTSSFTHWEWKTVQWRMRVYTMPLQALPPAVPLSQWKVEHLLFNTFLLHWHKIKTLKMELTVYDIYNHLNICNIVI